MNSDVYIQANGCPMAKGCLLVPKGPKRLNILEPSWAVANDGNYNNWSVIN
jgi:hypothetical protein